MGFVANFVHFPAVQNFENRLIFDKVTESLKVGTFLRHSVETPYTYYPENNFWCRSHSRSLRTNKPIL